MPKVHQIVENKKVLKYLKDRKLREQYVKAKNYLLAGLQNQVKFKEREPKGTNA